jgi:hypothetical protein
MKILQLNNGDSLKTQAQTCFLIITKKCDNLYNVDITSGTIENPSKLPNGTWWNLSDKYHSYNELIQILNRYKININQIN